MKIDSVAIFTKPVVSSQNDILLACKEIFNSHGIEAYLAKSNDDVAIEVCNDLNSVDLFISFGGDGTFIGCCREAYKYNKRVIGISAGTIGFLVDLKLSDMDKIISNVLNDEMSSYDMPLLNVDYKKSFKAINDVSFIRDSSKPFLGNIDFFVDGKFLNNYRGDGVIVTTPIGSTGYNLSAKGPIIFPTSNVLAITPVSPRSISQSPVIVNSNSLIEVYTYNDINMIIDGQNFVTLGSKSSVKISICEQKVKVLEKNDKDFFKNLRDKLNWGN